MADQKCNQQTSNPIIITESVDMDPPNSESSSCDRVLAEKNATNDTSISYTSNSNSSRDHSVNSIGTKPEETSNGVPKVQDKPVIKPSLFLRPSSLSGDIKPASDVGKCSLKGPKLNLAQPKLGNIDTSGSLKPPLMKPTTPGANVFSSFVSFDEKKTNNGKVDDTKNVNDGESLFMCKKTSTSSNPIPASPCVAVPNFVFGQNLHERVTDSIKPAMESSVNEASTSNGTSELLFSSVITNKDSVTNESTTSPKESSSLLEDAARCQEARANKRKYEEVHVTTGEEGEKNILQVNVKLFAFDNGAWVELGRGTLRLNDRVSDSSSGSRIVIRSLGSLRVVLNTIIWSGMSVCRASDRSLRLTAMDTNGHVKVFLVQSSPKDISTLSEFLDVRVKRCEGKPTETTTETPLKKLATESNET